MGSIAVDSLDIIVVGAGIAGLSAAIALRRGGHNVKIYERSHGNNELGAAIHVCSNASRILLGWGLDPVAARFVKAKKTYIAKGTTLDRVYERDYDEIESTYGAPWYFAHRIDLHNALKILATSPAGVGTPAQILTISKVVDYDPATATVTLENSNTDTADIIIAADGVHSQATKLVLGESQQALATEQSAFRFLITAQQLAADPKTAHFLEDDDGRFKVFLGDNGNRLVWYPCRDNEEHNFVGIFPEIDYGGREDWNKSSGLQELLDGYKDFHPSILAVLRKAADIKKWPLLYRAPTPKWYKSRLTLVGDAVHPMLPHQGQAGAQAIEDAAALGMFLGDLTKSTLRSDPAILSKRLELFQQVRSRRAAAMQIFSNVGQDQGEQIVEAVKPYVDGNIPKNPAEFIVYNFGYDVEKHSLQVLHEASN